MVIYDDIVNRIESGELAKNTLLPSEKDMMEAWSCSRDTVRKAMALLLSNGHIEKSQGRRSRIVEKTSYDFPVSKITSYQELVDAQSLRSHTEVVGFSLLHHPHPVFEKFGLEKTDERILEIVRVRAIDNERIILDKDYFRTVYVNGLTRDIAQQSVYRYIEEELGLEIGYAEKVITIQHPTPEDKALLDLRETDQIAVVDSNVYLADGTLFQRTISRHRSDKFRFKDFAHR